MLDRDANLDVVPICAMSDNYIWALCNPRDDSVFIVDPGDASPVLEWLTKTQHTLAGILITHHHYDHVAGVEQLLAHTMVPVYGPKQSPATCITEPLLEGICIILHGLECLIIEVPGHTLDHIAYYVKTPAPQAPILFSGDTLFAGGCGRLFEGTAEQMHDSLNKLAALPEKTRIYCGHEYTLANLRFALVAEPNNAELKQRLENDTKARADNRPTLPSTIALEKRTNPFLRTQVASVAAKLTTETGHEDRMSVDIFSMLRDWKDRF